jgi:hypothetical protein
VKVSRWLQGLFGLADPHPFESDPFGPPVVIPAPPKVHALEREPAWEEVEARLRLQLVPASVARHDSLIVFPLHHAVVIAVVVDDADGYAFIRHQDAARWGLPPGRLYAKAEEGLRLASADVRPQFVHRPNRCIVLTNRDGYDAARLLLPDFRMFMGKHLSTPFFAALPNRDFLLAWAEDCEPAFHAYAHDKVMRSWTERPHPLTGDLFRVDDKGVRG